MSHKRKPALLAAAAGSCVLGLMATAPAYAAPHQDEQATVSVFHGVPDTTVDVYTGDRELIPDFEPGTLSEPQQLDAGSYDLRVFEDGADPQEDDPVVEKTVEVPAGGNATVAAHLSAQGEPQLTSFVNDTSQVASGQARLTVRHVAAAPAVDVRAGGKALVEGLENPNEATTEVPSGTVSADVVLAGTDDVAIGPADLTLEEGTSTVVYAWGSADEDNLALKTQALGGGEHATPSQTPTGTPSGTPTGTPGGGNSALAGQVDDSTAWSVAGGASAALVATALAVARRRAAAGG
ncbi:MULTISPECIES: DUF4397 domain-containing protein [Streptomyces]|uniref:DUF4397 domain-containing protein n=1 Tax=Streptomyces TaxID=1883 RepID=UPI00224965AF|nr:DUF4397 domain-containing protein [Streptomyces sp. JHD 1]MCX2968522.1 DUF4397 domain-containing protein [Streptomyces sp. JHD 1]